MKYLTQKRHSNEPSLQGFLRYYVSFSFHNSPKKAREGSLPTTVILPASFFQKPSRSHSTLPQLTTQKRASAFCSGNTLWAVRASFEIQHLRRLSRGSAGPREHSRSWGLAQSCPAHVAAPWCCRPLPGSSPFATIFFSTYPHYPHIYPHPQFPSLWIPLCITLFT